MHQEQQRFCERVAKIFPEHFQGKNVLDAGSWDVNGNNRYLFPGCRYTGIDVAAGPNVDCVCLMHEYLPGQRDVFDTIISTEAFEHDRHFPRSARRLVELLKPDGLLLFTCATSGRLEHGTMQNHPGCSPATIHCGAGWEHYYRNIDVGEAVALGLEFFREFAVEVNQAACDLYFWGRLKKAAPAGS